MDGFISNGFSSIQRVWRLDSSQNNYKHSSMEWIFLYGTSSPARNSLSFEELSLIKATNPFVTNELSSK